MARRTRDSGAQQPPCWQYPIGIVMALEALGWGKTYEWNPRAQTRQSSASGIFAGPIKRKIDSKTSYTRIYQPLVVKRNINSC